MELIQKTGIRVNQPSQEDLNEMLFFVPLDFSAVSYHALHYAVELARESGGSIHLFHVADIREVADSDNPVVVKRSLDRLEKKASTKLDSLKEIIIEAGIQRVTSQVELGNVRSSMYKQILSVHPDIIVIGRRTDSTHHGSLASYLLRYSSAPLLFVPAPFRGNVFLSKQSLIISDSSSVHSPAMRRYNRFAKKTGQQPAILQIGGGTNSGKKMNTHSHPMTGDPMQYSSSSRADLLSGIREHLKVHPVDLVCAIRKHVPFWKRPFVKDWTLSVLHHISLPTLLISERQRINK